MLTPLELDAIFTKAYQDGLKIDAIRPPSKLYHYTTADTALKILTSRNIHFSHIREMEDSAEFRHGMEIHIQKFSKCFRTPHFSSSLIQKYKQFAAKDWKNPIAVPMIFSCASSPYSNYLWDRFGDESRGVCLEIAIETDSDFRRSLQLAGVNVVYDMTVQMDLTNGLLEHLRETLLQDQISEIDQQKVIHPFTRAIHFGGYFNSCRFKRGKYRKEQEWRLVSVVGREDPAIESKVVRGKTTKYISKPIDISTTVKKILIGNRISSDIQYLLTEECSKLQIHAERI